MVLVKVDNNFVPPTAIEVVEHKSQQDITEESGYTSPSPPPCGQDEAPEGGCDVESPTPVDTPVKKYKPWPKMEPVKPIEKEKPIKIKKERTGFKFNFWKTFSIFSMIVFLALACGYLYMVNEGKMTPLFSQNNSFEPVVNVENPITNNYDFEPENNFTIVNEITCPDVVCNCGNNS